jgi:hypothetical protein
MGLIGGVFGGRTRTEGGTKDKGGILILPQGHRRGGKTATVTDLVITHIFLVMG